MGKLVDLAGLIAASGLPGRVIAADNLHITLRFFGSSTSEQVQIQQSAIANLAGKFSCIRTAAASLKWMPRRKSRMLWLALCESSSLTQLNAELAQLADMPHKPQAHFHAHVTLLRGEKSSLPESIMQAASMMDDLVFDRICLMRSHLHESGARYEIVQQHYLSAS